MEIESMGKGRGLGKEPAGREVKEETEAATEHRHARG
jgi:hypothetical protein